MIAPLRESFNETLRRSATAWRKSSMIVKHDELAAEYDRRQWNQLAIVLTCLSCTASDLNFSMLVSFFPEAARQRGLSPMATGILFAIFQIFNLLTCFAVPWFTKKFGGIRVLATANLCQAALAAGIATTGTIHSSTPFFWTFLTLRCLQGVVAAFSEVAAGGIVTRSVPNDRIGEAVEWVKISRILGIVCGPLIGGKMFSTFGYAAPFTISASLLLVLGLLTIFMPIDMTLENNSDEDAPENVTLKLIRRPIFVVILFALTITSTAITYIEPTLQLYMAQAPYNLSHTQVGAMYIISTVCFAVVATFASPLVKCLGNTLSLSMGVGLMGLAYTILAPPEIHGGPLSLFAFLHQSSQWSAIALTATGMAIIGIGGGLILGPANNFLLGEGEYIGLGAGVSSASIAMMINMAFTSGGAIGPFLSGLLTDHIGFSKSCVIFGYFILACTIPILIVIIAIQIFRKKSEAHSSESHAEFLSPLLEDDQNIL